MFLGYNLCLPVKVRPKITPDSSKYMGLDDFWLNLLNEGKTFTDCDIRSAIFLKT